MRDLDGNRLDSLSIKERLEALEASVSKQVGASLAYSENGTGVITSVPVFAASSTVIPYTLIDVPGGSDPVDIEYGAAFTVGTSGGGLLALELWDVTAGGAGTIKHATGRGVVAANLALYSGLVQTVRGQHRLDISATDRVFQLKCLLYRDGAPNLTASVVNAARNSTGGGQPTFISAVKR